MRSSILRRRLLRVALVTGGLFDLSLAILLVAPSASGAGAFGPASPFYPRSSAILLASLGAAGLLAANEPPRFAPLIPVVALERLALAALLGPAGGGLAAAVVGSLAGTETALAFALLWGQVRSRR